MINLHLVWELTKRDFTEQFAGSILGAVWAIIWPLVNLAIYIVIFGKFMGGRLPGNSVFLSYGVYVAVGLVPWAAFSSTLSRCSMVFLDKKYLISKINISLPALLVYICLSETITFLITMSILFVFLAFTGYEFPTAIILVPFIYYLQQLFAMGLGLLMATFTVFIQDLKQVVGVVLQFWFWFTPIVYVFDILPDFMKNLIHYNPAFTFIHSYQRIFVFQQLPDFDHLILLSVITHLILLFSYFCFRTLEKDVRDFL